MKQEIHDQLAKKLRELEKFDSGIVGTAIVNRNGLLLASRLPLDIDNRKFGAMVAALLNGMESAMVTINNKKIQHITVEMSDYQILTISIDDKLFLASLIAIDCNFGLILIEIEEFIKKIKSIL
ncbi:MAG: roadblock/LC7 domain-containing protein [Promethearchaeota archaeon]